jgi:hypothetical protein
MLNEDQVQRLLTDCERAVAQPLKSLRGNLLRIKSRAAAIWELIVIDAVAKLGPIKYEPPISDAAASRPDLHLEVARRGIWIEATYVQRRFPDNERLEQRLVTTIHRETDS